MPATQSSTTDSDQNTKTERNVFVHPSSYIDDGCIIGAGTKIWHFSHVMKGARIGERCVLGQNVSVAAGVIIGNNVKIQNNVSLYTGVILEDDVFCGPSCVFTNLVNPRAQIVRHHLYERTLVRRGATIGTRTVEKIYSWNLQNTASASEILDPT